MLIISHFCFVIIIIFWFEIMSQSPNRLQVPAEKDFDNVSVTSKAAYEDG